MNTPDWKMCDRCASEFNAADGPCPVCLTVYPGGNEPDFQTQMLEAVASHQQARALQYPALMLDEAQTLELHVKGPDVDANAAQRAATAIARYNEGMPIMVVPPNFKVADLERLVNQLHGLARPTVVLEDHVEKLTPTEGEDLLRCVEAAAPGDINADFRARMWAAVNRVCKEPVWSKAKPATQPCNIPECPDLEHPEDLHSHPNELKPELAWRPAPANMHDVSMGAQVQAALKTARTDLRAPMDAHYEMDLKMTYITMVDPALGATGTGVICSTCGAVGADCICEDAPDYDTQAYWERVDRKQAKKQGCKLDTDGDGNCPRHPDGCPPEDEPMYGGHIDKPGAPR